MRDWLFIGLFLAIFSTFAVSNMIGFTATTEKFSMQLVIFAGITRIILVCGMIVFICFHISRAFENREISFILSKNISREKFIFSYWLGFNIISLVFILQTALTIVIFSKYSFAGLLEWLLSVVFELMIISTFSILTTLILGSAVFSVFLSSGFYLISRLMGFFINVQTLNSKNIIYDVFLSVIKFLIKFISSIIPRLDLFGQTKWLIYGPDTNMLYVMLAQFTIYISIMFMMAFYDFKRKEF
jgi:hypothetical protein